jgi:hypothetical protein
MVDNSDPDQANDAAYAAYGGAYADRTSQSPQAPNTERRTMITGGFFVPPSSWTATDPGNRPLEGLNNNDPAFTRQGEPTPGMSRYKVSFGEADWAGTTPQNQEMGWHEEISYLANPNALQRNPQPWSGMLQQNPLNSQYATPAQWAEGIFVG